MNDLGIIGLVIILANFVISYTGFKTSSFFNKYKFQVDRILIDKEYYRLISSGFLHANWFHLFLNMLSLYSFIDIMESDLGAIKLCILYFSTLILGNLLALFINRNYGDYSAIGASGAVCGVIFAAISLYPGMKIGFPLIDFSLQSWLFGVLFVAITLFGIKSKFGNIGHEAHLGGAICGVLIAVLFKPMVLSQNLTTILLIIIPSSIFIAFIIYKPEYLMIDNYFGKKESKHISIEHKYNEEKVDRQNEIDRILEKIKSKGIDSLSKKERRFLDKH